MFYIDSQKSFASYFQQNVVRPKYKCLLTFSTFSKSLRTVPAEEVAVVVGGPTGMGSTTTSAASLSWLMEGEFVKFAIADGR